MNDIISWVLLVVVCTLIGAGIGFFMGRVAGKIKRISDDMKGDYQEWRD